MGELIDVSHDAGALIDYLRSPNAVPLSFPTHQLIEISRSLLALPEGTAEGCRAPLEYARVRLPAIRREHISSGDTVLTASEDEIPPLVRGMGLDRLLRDLIASVTTALDEYRKQATEAFDDFVGAEPFANAGLDPRVVDGIEKSSELELRLEVAVETITVSTNTESENADLLLRRVKDVEAVNRLARAELQMRSVVLRWYKSVVDRMQNYPKLIRDIGNGIDVAVDVLKPMNRRWHQFWEEFSTFGLEQIQLTAKTLMEIGNILEKKRQYRSNLAPIDQINPKRIRAEQEARELILSGLPVPQQTATLVEDLDLSGRNNKRVKIPNIRLINNFDNLKRLNLALSNVDDLSFADLIPHVSSLAVEVSQEQDLRQLNILPNLTSLSIERYKGLNLDPLEHQTKLTSLRLGADNITDINMVAKLSALKSLSVDAPVNDVAPIADLHNLTSLRIKTNRPQNIAMLRNLTNLTVLSLTADNIDDISFLNELTDLTSLILVGKSIKNIKPLSNLANLSYLTIQSEHLADIEPLSNLNNLRSLAVGSNQLVDLAPLTNLSGLTSLGIQSSRAVDLRPIGKLTNLNFLSMQSPTPDLGPLSNLHQLETLTLQTNVAKDLTPLSALKYLKSLTVHAHKVINFGPIKGLTQLVSLGIASDSASDLSPLSNLTKLTSLKITGWKITDISPLSNLTNVATLNITHTGVSNLKPLARWRNLEELNIKETAVTDISDIQHIKRIIQ